MTKELAAQTLADVKFRIAQLRTEFRQVLAAGGRKRQGIPVGPWARRMAALNCNIGRLETGRMLCDWFARGVQPSYMDWDRDVAHYVE